MQPRAFSGGVAAVCKDGKWGFINGRGTQVIDYLLVEAGYFDANGKCPAKMDGNDTQVMLSWRGSAAERGGQGHERVETKPFARTGRWYGGH